MGKKNKWKNRKSNSSFGNPKGRAAGHLEGKKRNTQTRWRRRRNVRNDLIQMLADSNRDLNVSLINDFAFKHVFHNKKALKGLLSALLDIPPEEIVDLELLDTFQSGSYKQDKVGILDIKVHLNNNQKINIEMQVRQQESWKERSLFYLGRMYTADIVSGEDYGVLEPCIHISIICFDMPELSRLYSVIRLIEEHTGQVYSDKLSLRVLYLKKLEDADEAEQQTEIYRWAKLITAEDWEVLRGMAMQDEYKAEVVKEMEKINSDRALRYEYISREIARMDAISYAKDKKKLRTEREELRAEWKKLRTVEEELHSGQEKLHSWQEELRSWQEELRKHAKNMARREEDMNRREEDMNRREEDMRKHEEGLRQTQIKFQLATHMMVAGEAELFLKLENDPELFRQKVREYHLDT
ncbi:MAG: Rpn family recombination-promoting nuclease/putative transposase [Lachnospiraceae bacterium]|nr:Rpn family recombination-promoting nuclease/putative transposase [Lachnospiraceae bacterium]